MNHLKAFETNVCARVTKIRSGIGNQKVLPGRSSRSRWAAVRGIGTAQVG
jgi:hypothetical protein